MKLAAAFVESSESPKIFATASCDTDIVNVAPASDTTTIASQLQSKGYTRSICYFNGTAGSDSAEATEAIDAAMFALIAAFKSGYYNTAYKTPAGITPDLLNSSQEAYSRGVYVNGIFVPGKDCNTFEKDYDIVRWGRTCAGGWIDQVIFIDNLCADLQAAVFNRFKNTQKVPRDINGYATIEAAIEKVFKDYQKPDASGAYAITQYDQDSDGKQSGGYIISMPKPGDASDADKTGRVVTGITWVVWYATPTNSVKMTGVIAL